MKFGKKQRPKNYDNSIDIIYTIGKHLKIFHVNFASKFKKMAVLLSSDSEFKSQLEKFDKVIVKYYAGWCGTCKLFAPKYRRLSGDERFEGVTFLDVNAEENELARKMAGVDNLPFFATFKNGELVEAKSTSKEDQVVAMIENIQ